MAIQRYDRKEAIDPSAPRVDFSGAQIADPGQVFRQTSRSLLNAVEPLMEQRAIDRGTKAGAKAPMMRGEDGILRRAPLPREGGLVYGEAYKRAMNTIYKGRLLFDAEITYDEIQTRNRDNPEQALIELRAHAEAVTQTVPDDIRAEIEPDLFREAIQRFNGLNADKIQRDNRQAIQELSSQYSDFEKALYQDLTRLSAEGDQEGFSARMTQGIALLDENQQARKALTGGLTPVGEEGEDAVVMSSINAINSDFLATQGVALLIARGKELVSDRTALELMVEWNLGGDVTNGEGRVNGMNYDEYRKFLKNETGVAKAARWAAEQIQALDKQEQDAKQAAKDAEDEKTDQEKREAIAVLGSMALSNPDYFKIWDADFNKHVLASAPNITTFLNSEENRDWAVAQVGFGGKLPTALKQFMMEHAGSSYAHHVMDIAEKMLGKRNGQTGIYTGMQAWRELPKETRAVITRYRELSDMEVPTEQRRTILDDIMTGKWEVRNPVQAFKDEDGKPSVKLYTETRDRYAKAIFGKEYNMLPSHIANEIEGSVKSFLAVYGQDRDTAVRKAIESVATLWSPHPIGKDGYIPTELKGLNLTVSQLDYAFGNFDGKKFVTPGGGGFTTSTRPINGVRLPRARITLMDDSQLPEGAGNYLIEYYDIDGNYVGKRENVNIDQVLSKHFGNEAKYRQQLQRARREGMKASRATFQSLMGASSSSRRPVRRGRDY